MTPGIFNNKKFSKNLLPSQQITNTKKITILVQKSFRRWKIKQKYDDFRNINMTGAKRDRGKEYMKNCHYKSKNLIYLINCHNEECLHLVNF